MKGEIKKIAKRIRGSRWVWQNVLNFKPSMQYRARRNRLSEVQARVLNDLNTNGIAITHVEELLDDQALYLQLERFLNETEDKLADSIREARARAEDISTKKDFLYLLLGEKPTLNAQDINVRFALQHQIVDVVNAYFGCLTKLRYYNIWHTFTSKTPRRSMFWHQDPEDKLILKVFLYLSDVDDGAGPFVYAPQTHPKGKTKTQPESFKEDGRNALRSTDEQMNLVVPKERWIKAVGRKGTIIFADTKGFHKGGFATSTDRIMYNCLFVSPASKAQETFYRTVPLNFEGLTNAQKFELTP